MSLDTDLISLIKEAMLSKDEVRLRTLRALKTAFSNAKTEKGADGKLSDDQEVKIIQKLHKQRKDASELYIEQNRQDLADKELEEMQVLEDFLPKQLSDADLESEIQAIIQQVGAQSMADMGKVMGIASKKLAGQAEGARISSVVRSLLS